MCLPLPPLTQLTCDRLAFGLVARCWETRPDEHAFLSSCWLDGLVVEDGPRYHFRSSSISCPRQADAYGEGNEDCPVAVLFYHSIALFFRLPICRVMSTSGRIQGEFLRLLYILDHWCVPAFSAPTADPHSFSSSPHLPPPHSAPLWLPIPSFPPMRAHS